MLYSLQDHREKNDVEVTEYGGEIWINQKHLGRKLDLQIADRAQYYSSGFKKRDAKYKSVVNINLKEFLLKIL